VRSVPYSRRFPQFDRAKLEASLHAAAIGYVFLGDVLGGRPASARGPVDYERIAATPSFDSGLRRVEQEGAARRVALMCAENAPLDCHRTVLDARHLVRRGHAVDHILADGTITPHGAIEETLLKRHAPVDDLLTVRLERDARLALAYRARGLQMTGASRR
jgi:uncharacterized protein (DUF488 family)